MELSGMQQETNIGSPLTLNTNQRLSDSRPFLSRQSSFREPLSGSRFSTSTFPDTPTSHNSSCQPGVFTFDSIPVSSSMGFQCQPTERGTRDFFSPNKMIPSYSRLNSSLLSPSYSTDQSNIDPYYMPDFRNNTKLSDVFHTDDDLSSSLPCHYTDVSPHHPLSLSQQCDYSYQPSYYMPSSYDNGISSNPSQFRSFSASPAFSRRPLLPELPKSYESTYVSPSKQPLYQQSNIHLDISTHGSPQRPRRNTLHSRGGSPGSGDLSNVVHIDDIKSGKDKRTTLMIKNIPNAFTREAILELIDTFCKNKYDFFYLPIDQKTCCNLGYGYINMVDIPSVIELYYQLNGKKWANTRSTKVCSICYGRIQKEAEDLVHYCSDWSVMTSDEKYHPLFFTPSTKIVDGKEVTVMERYIPEVNLSMKSTK